MNLPDEPPQQINPLPFIIADAVLLITAFFIAIESPAPLATLPLAAITACVILGAILGCLPIVLNYTRRADARLDERQAELAALAKTTAAAAHQIGIAASGLHGIAENTARMLKHADALPTRLQEKVAEFKTQLNEVNIAENETLEQEIAALRTSETERLETALENIRKTAAEIMAREAGVQKQSDDAARQLARISGELKTALETLSAQIPAAIETSRRSLEQSVAASIETRGAETLARLAAELSGIENGIKERLTAWLAEQPQLAQKPAAPPAEPPPAAPAHMHVQPKNTPKADDAVRSNAGDDTPAANNEPPSKKTARHPPAAARAQAQEKPNPEKSIPVPPPPETKTPDEPPPAPSSADEAASQTHGQDARASTQPDTPPPSKPQPAGPQSPEEPSESPPPPQKKRAAKPKPPRDDEPVLDLDLPPVADEYSQSEPEDGGFTTAISADGVTRLIVTAYIGIGNKLHIRGDGPGLSWDKGVPLQFVSIGKWRWETHDATAPVSFKLYKNDSVECTRIGSPQLEPGHQHEITANF